MEQKVLYIDDNSNSRLLYSDILREVFGADYRIEAISPLSSIQEMSSFIIEQDELIAIVLDEKMNGSGQANYTGLELANNLRRIYKKLPIYILTSFIDDIENDENLVDVEQTISKEQIQDPDERKIISGRIRRQLGTLNVIQDENQKRFHELLEKSLYDELSETELKDYKNLNVFRSSKKQYGEIQENQELKRILNEKKQLLKKIEHKLEGLDN